MSLPTPNTRKEQYLNAIATGNPRGLPTPITREEEYLEAIAKGGGSGDGDMKKSVYDSDLDVAGAGGISAFVRDAVDEVKSKSWSLGSGISIANNTDLNDITTVGNYYATTAASATLSHCPITGAFKLKVLYDVRETASAYIEQVFNPISSYDEYRRYKSGSAAWSDWHLTNCNLDEEKGKVTANAEAIEAMVNVTGACNLANNDATTKTDSGVLFTVNSDNSVTVQRQSPTADPYSYIKLFDNKTLPAVKMILSGCPNVTGLTLYLYDKTTSTRYNQTGDAIEVTPDASHTYSLVIEALNSADLDTAVTVYPMLYDARLNPSGYVPYAMTNRELTERFAVITGNTASDANVTTFPYPQGFTKDNTFIVTLAIYINSYWYQYNNTTTFYAATANGSVNVVAEDAGARDKPIKLLLMRV